MALKQAEALAAMAEAGSIIKESFCEAQGCYFALADAKSGRRLLCAAKGASRFDTMWKDVELEYKVKDISVKVLKLNANNAALVRRLLKWTAPCACGNRGLSIAFCDWLGAADAEVVELFRKRRLRPVLVDMTPEDSTAIGRNFLEAVDTATWGVLAKGYRDGYGANAACLKSEDDIVKALLYGYSMIGIDATDKINLEIEGLSDAEVNKRFSDFNITFQAAVHASYLNAEFKVGKHTVKFTETQLHRIILEYGEAIMHIQFLYNSYLKNTPWDIDFELYLSKPGKVMTVEEHYLVANELERNGVKLASICLDPLIDSCALGDDLEFHCEIAQTFCYRLSLAHADTGLINCAAASKYLKDRVHFKLNNLLFKSALEIAAQKAPDLAKKLEVAQKAENSQQAEVAYRKILGAKDLATELKAIVDANKEAYFTAIKKKTLAFISSI